MRKASCGTCSSEHPVAELLALYDKPICRPCAEEQLRAANSAGHNLEFVRIVDRTICGICKVDYGSSDLPFVGGVPVCANCSKGLYERPYPGWLKLTLAGLLLLLAGSLWRGLPYFKAGRHLVLAERAMDRKDYKTASAHFAEVLKVSPTEQKAVLLGAKANLMLGDVEGAQRFLKLRDNFEKNDLFTEVNALWNRALDAYEKGGRASKLADANQDEEAARLMREASNEYPQSSDLATSALSLEAGVAFSHKDYDGFLQISRTASEKSPEDPVQAGAVASALACKYAVSGDPEFRKQAEQMIEKARALARSPEDKANFEEYAERIRYRLDSRVIIDKTEYNRRFRQKGVKQ
jgi:hypothetical protein